MADQIASKVKNQTTIDVINDRSRGVYSYFISRKEMCFLYSSQVIETLMINEERFVHTCQCNCDGRILDYSYLKDNLGNFAQIRHTIATRETKLFIIYWETYHVFPKYEVVTLSEVLSHNIVGKNT